MANLFKTKINWQYVAFLIKRNTKFMVLAAIAMFALYPLNVFTSYILSGSGEYDVAVFLVGRFTLTMLLVLSIFIVPLNLFSYLNSKRNLDVYHALPIKRQDLFLSVFVSAIIIILIPYTLVYAVGGGYGLAVIPQMDFVLMLKQYGYSLVMTLAILVPILFTMMNTGTTVDGFLYSGLLHVFPALGYGAYILFASTTLLGFTPNSDLLFLLFSTPIYTLFDLNFNVDRIYPQVWMTLSYWLIFSAIMTLVVMVLYKHRKSERAENPFTNKWYFPIFTTALIMVVQVFFYTLFSNLSYNQQVDARTLIFPVVFTLVGYIILDVIANRGFKHFFKAIVSFVIITAVTISFFFGMIKTRGFGYITHVPKLSSIQSVEIRINDSDGTYGYPDHFRYSMYYNPQHEKMTFDDPKQIEIIQKTHQNILNEYKKNNYNLSVYDHFVEPDFNHKLNIVDIKIVYKLKNNAKTTRSYQARAHWIEPLEQLMSTEPFFNSLNHPLADLVSDSSFIKVQGLSAFDIFDTNPTSLDVELAKDFALAYKKDYLKKSVQEHFNVTTILGYVALDACTNDVYKRCFTKSHPITDLDSETIAFLTNNAVDLSIIDTEDRSYFIAIKPKTVHDARLFRSTIGRYDLFDVEVDLIKVSHAQVLELLPYLRYGRGSSKAYDVLLVEKNPLRSYDEMDMYDDLSYFSYLIEKNDLVDEWLDDSNIRSGWLYQLLN